jgi:hypothetical protein
MSNVTEEGKHLIERWEHAKTNAADLKRSLNKAECEESNSSHALGKWLMPHDAKLGEVFSVWHGDSLIEVTVTENGPTLRVRSRGKT